MYRRAYSLLELLAMVSILGLLAAVIVPRVVSGRSAAQAGACHTYQGDIEIQVERWRYNNGSLPLADLSDIGADGNYFPEGVPVCPVDGTTYTIDTQTGLIIGHSH